MTTHSEAMRTAVHGPIRPARETTFSKVATMIRNRPRGEPHPLVGIALLSALSVIALLWLVAVSSAASGPDRTGTTTPARVEAASGDTGGQS